MDRSTAQSGSSRSTVFMLMLMSVEVWSSVVTESAECWWLWALWANLLCNCKWSATSWLWYLTSSLMKYQVNTHYSWNLVAYYYLNTVSSLEPILLQTFVWLSAWFYIPVAIWLKDEVMQPNTLVQTVWLLAHKQLLGSTGTFSQAVCMNIEHLL